MKTHIMDRLEQVRFDIDTARWWLLQRTPETLHETEAKEVESLIAELQHILNIDKGHRDGTEA